MDKHKDLIMDMQIFLIHKYKSREEEIFPTLVQIIASDEKDKDELANAKKDNILLENVQSILDNFDDAMKTNDNKIKVAKKKKNEKMMMRWIKEREEIKMDFKQKMLEKSFKKQDVSQHYGQTSKDILKKYMTWNLPPDIYATKALVGPYSVRLTSRAYMSNETQNYLPFLDLQKETFIEWLSKVEGGTEHLNDLKYWHARKNYDDINSEKQKLFINALEKLMLQAKKRLNGNPFECGKMGVACKGGRRRKSRKTKRKRRKSRKTKRKRRKSRKTKKRRRRRR